MKKQKNPDSLKESQEIAQLSMKQTIEALSKPQKVFFPTSGTKVQN